MIGSLRDLIGYDPDCETSNMPTCSKWFYFKHVCIKYVAGSNEYPRYSCDRFNYECRNSMLVLINGGIIQPAWAGLSNCGQPQISLIYDSSVSCNLILLSRLFFLQKKTELLQRVGYSSTR